MSGRSDWQRRRNHTRTSSRVAESNDQVSEMHVLLHPAQLHTKIAYANSSYGIRSLARNQEHPGRAVGCYRAIPRMPWLQRSLTNFAGLAPGSANMLG